MTVIMRDAIKPNLLQTLENTPVLVHAGPFGNIAHGNSSVVADLIGIHTGDYLITEAGFGADMGAERFFNIKCRVSGLRPRRRRGGDHGPGAQGALGQAPGRGRAGRCREALLEENPDDVLAGASNLRKQIENVRAARGDAGRGDQRDARRLPLRARRHRARWPPRWGCARAVCTHFADGGRGAAELAEAVAEAAAEPSSFRFLYPAQASLREKIEAIAPRRLRRRRRGLIARRGAHSWTSSSAAVSAELPVCIAKTHLSLSSDPAAQGSAHRVAAAGAGGAGLGRGRFHLPDLRRYADHARADLARRRRAHRRRRQRPGRRPVVTGRKCQQFGFLPLWGQKTELLMKPARRARP